MCKGIETIIKLRAGGMVAVGLWALQHEDRWLLRKWREYQQYLQPLQLFLIILVHLNWTEGGLRYMEDTNEGQWCLFRCTEFCMLATETHFCKVHKQKDTFAEKQSTVLGGQEHWPNSHITGMGQRNFSYTRPWCRNIRAICVSLSSPPLVHVTSCMNND